MMPKKESSTVIVGDFEWEESKETENVKRHDNIAFREALTVFDDSLFVVFVDPDHSIEEKRYIIIGTSNENQLLFVSYAEREHRTRIIGARRVTRKEKKDYEKKLKEGWQS